MLDEGLHERPVLVQRRLRVRRVFLERELQFRTALDVPEQGAERPEAEGPQGGVQVRSAHDHGSAYAAGGSSPFWHSGHQ